jgi:tungstate transport system ATP-binding protein
MTDKLQFSTVLPLKVSGLTFIAEGKRLLDNVSFILPKGGITALIGPNGAGKSLTLRLCHGLIAATSGRVEWQAAEQQRHAMVFQRPVMLRRSVKANVMYGLNVSHYANGAARCDLALARFGLAELASRPARLLSGGEQQRLAIARAWALEPEVLFMDEPTAQLDPGATRQIEAIIAAMAADGMTILMTTHDLGQARRLSQRVLFLNRGRLLEDARCADFFASPVSPEARVFIRGDLLW